MEAKRISSTRLAHIVRQEKYRQQQFKKHYYKKPEKSKAAGATAALEKYRKRKRYLKVTRNL